MAESHEYRNRFFVGNFVFLGILVAILIVVFALSGHLNRWKLDLTRDRIYTVSDATKKILGNLKDKVTVTYYCSAELPGFLQNLRRDTRDLFDEFYDLSGGKFEYSIVNPEDRANEYAEERTREYLVQRQEFEEKKREEKPKEPTPPQSIEDIFSGRKSKTEDEIREERQKTASIIAQHTNRKKEDVERDLLREAYKSNYLRELELRGIAPFPITERQASSVRQVRIFSAMELKYLRKDPEIIPIHYSIENLEYELASRILKLTQTEKPVIAFFDGRKPPMPKFDPMNPVQPPPSDYEAIVNHLSQFYDIRWIEVKENDSIDDLVKRLKEDLRRKEKKGEEEKESEADKEIRREDYGLVKAFVVAQPDQLEPRQVYEINRAASLGIPTIFLVSPYSMDISESGLQQGIPLRLLYPGLDDMFRKWGLELRKELLASNNAGSVLLQTTMGPRGGLRVLVERPLPINVSSEGAAIDRQSPLTNRLNQLVFPATTGLRLLTETLAANKLEHAVLAKTTRETWSVEIDPFRQSPFQRGRLMGPSVAQYREELASMKDPAEFRDFIEPVPLAVHIKGKIPFTYQGETIPEWRKEKEKEKEEDKDSSLFLNPEDPGVPEGAPSGGSSPAQESKPEVGAAPGGESQAAPAEGAPKPETKPEETEKKEPAGVEGKLEPGAAQPSQASPEAKAAAEAGGKPEAKPEEKEAPKPEAPKGSVELAEGNVVVLASVDMLKNHFLMQRSGDYMGNVLFMQNALDTFGLGNELINVRIKQLTLRQFKEGSWLSPGWIIFLSLGAVPGLVAIAGLAYYFYRRHESNQYERRFLEQ